MSALQRQLGRSGTESASCFVALSVNGLQMRHWFRKEESLTRWAAKAMKRLEEMFRMMIIEIGVCRGYT